MFPLPRSASRAPRSSAFAFCRWDLHVAFIASAITHYQAMLLHSASSLLKIFCHRFGSESLTGSQYDDLLPVGNRLNIIIGSPKTFLPDDTLNNFKPTVTEALSH
jgi:hypothetical protein